jgi:hypothetical protein
LESISDEVETELNYYLKLFVIVYADDSVLMSKSQEDLQKQLVRFNRKSSITKCSAKMLSIVKYSFLNPNWFSCSSK